MKKLGLIAHLDRPQVGEATERIIKWTEEQRIPIKICNDLATLVKRNDIASDNKQIGLDCEVIISLGGDGSMLSSARAAGNRSVPILGINLGSLGFLTEVAHDRIIESLERLRDDKYTVEERMVLEVYPAVDGSDGHFALNDVVIDHGESTRLVHLDLLANDEFVSSYNADGIIISTPTGSTAYSLSVGGPIFNPSMEAIAVSPISPHTLTLRSIIFPANNILTIKVGKTKGKLRVSVDGRIVGSLESRQIIIIQRASHKIKLVRFGARSFYSVLRKKLHWGKRPLMNG
ncbi:MAG: NAD(+)/NADH kinase [candidate division Zixibacteria bacterium]